MNSSTHTKSSLKIWFLTLSTKSYLINYPNTIVPINPVPFKTFTSLLPPPLTKKFFKTTSITSYLNTVTTVHLVSWSALSLGTWTKFWNLFLSSRVNFDLFQDLTSTSWIVRKTGSRVKCTRHIPPTWTIIKINGNTQAPSE